MEKLTNEFKIEYVKGDTYTLAIKFKNITEDLSKAYLTVKENPDDSPVIQKSLGAGISKIDDRAYKNEKTYKVQLQPADTVNVEPKVQYLYDIQVTIGTVVKTVLHGIFVLGSTITGTAGITTQELEVEIDDEIETELATVPATNGVEYEQDPVACAKIGDMTTLDTTNKDTVVKAINEVNKGVNEIEDGTTVVPKASNVLSQINGQNITEIFEDDGTTAKNSSNVASKINGQLISNIFEDDGVTVKNATKVNNFEVVKDENGVLKIDGIIIPQRILLADISSNPQTSVVLEQEINAGDTLEIFYGLVQANSTYFTGVMSQKLLLDENKKLRQPFGLFSFGSISEEDGKVVDYELIEFSGQFEFNSNGNTILINSYTPYPFTTLATELTNNITSATFTQNDNYKYVIYKVYKIIE